MYHSLLIGSIHPKLFLVVSLEKIEYTATWQKKILFSDGRESRLNLITKKNLPFLLLSIITYILCGIQMEIAYSCDEQDFHTRMHHFIISTNFLLFLFQIVKCI